MRVPVSPCPQLFYLFDYSYPNGCEVVKKGFFFFLKYLFIYFLAVSGLSCSTWGLSLWHVGLSLVVARGLSCPEACGILVP